jgi:uncharacterized protein (DUF2267 family)
VTGDTALRGAKARRRRTLLTVWSQTPIALLSQALHPALQRRRDHSKGNAQRLSLDGLIARVADREKVSYEQASDNARAVFATVGEALSGKEYSDVLAELPRGYHQALV